MESNTLIQVLVSALGLILGAGGLGVWLKYKSDIRKLEIDERKNLEEAKYRELERMEKQYGFVTSGFERLLKANKEELERVQASITAIQNLASEQGKEIKELRKMEEECLEERKELNRLKAKMLQYTEQGMS